MMLLWYWHVSIALSGESIHGSGRRTRGRVQVSASRRNSWSFWKARSVWNVVCTCTSSLAIYVVYDKSFLTQVARYADSDDFVLPCSFLQVGGDLEDLEQALGKKDAKRVRGSGSCSALIKLLPGNKDLYVSHDTWNSYQSMIRVLKKYSFPYQMKKAGEWFMIKAYGYIVVNYCSDGQWWLVKLCTCITGILATNFSIQVPFPGTQWPFRLTQGLWCQEMTTT